MRLAKSAKKWRNKRELRIKYFVICFQFLNDNGRKKCIPVSCQLQGFLPDIILKKKTNTIRKTISKGPTLIIFSNYRSKNFALFVFLWWSSKKRMREFQTKPTVYSLFISIANYLWLGSKISFSGQLDYSSNTGYPVHCHLLHCLLFQEIKSFSRRVWRVSYSLTCKYWSESRPWFFIKALTC